jgi:hypothetical protein
MFQFMGILCPSASGAVTAPPQGVFPLNALQDIGKFTIYVNEEAVATIDSDWKAGGTFDERITVSLGGQSFSSTMRIEVDAEGLWKTITMDSPRGSVLVTRDGMTASIKAQGRVQTVELRPGTVLFENSSPALMSQAVLSYDQAKGGAQTFPLFIVPSVVMDASLERLETVERFVMGEPRVFTVYRYALPGVDLIVWMDEDNRLCLGDVPAQRAAYVREGYEALRIRPETDSLLSRPTFEVTVEKNVMMPMVESTMLIVIEGAMSGMVIRKSF